jgi:hypothetical protein
MTMDKRRFRSNEQTWANYDILFLGTRFVDGHYRELQQAIDITVNFQDTFPNIRCVPVEVLVPYRILDKDFWRNNIEELERINAANSQLEDLDFYIRYKNMIDSNPRYVEYL